MAGDDLRFGLSALATLLAMVDPVGTVPFFLSLAPATPDGRRTVARRACLAAAGIMFFFAIVGQPLLRLLRISIPAFQIAGGVLLFLIAVDMLFARRSGARETAEEEADILARRQDVSIFPLAIPLISGPGTITAVVILVGQASADLLRLGLVAVAIVLTMLVQWLVLLGAEPLLRGLGVTGVHVSSRVMGTLLSALAVQMILDGARAAGVIG